MLFHEKIGLVKNLPLLRRMPERALTAMAKALRPRELKSGEFLFRQGSPGLSLYFISRGHVRLSMSVAEGGAKDVAILGPGDLFGEGALIESATRTAGAQGIGDCFLFELVRGDFAKWVKQNPEPAVTFFAELVQVQSRRLRKTTSELALQSDLFNLLLASAASDEEFAGKVFARVLPHLDGAWSAALYLFEEPGRAPGLAASSGGYDFGPAAAGLDAERASADAWLDATTYHATLLGRERPLGRLLFHASTPLAEDDLDDIARTLNAVAGMTAVALEVRGVFR